MEVLGLLRLHDKGDEAAFLFGAVRAAAAAVTPLFTCVFFFLCGAEDEFCTLCGVLAPTRP